MSGRSTEVPGRVDATDESGDERGSAFALATTVAFGAALGSAGLNDPLDPVRETSLVPAVDDVLAGTRMVLLVVTGVDAEAVSRSARAVPDVLTSLSRSARADVSAGRVRSSRTARADASAGRGRSPPSRTARVDVVTSRDGSPLSRAARGDVAGWDGTSLSRSARGDVAARLDERPSTTPAESRELLPSTPVGVSAEDRSERLGTGATEEDVNRGRDAEVGSESPAGLSLTSACSGTQTHLHSPLAPGAGGGGWGGSGGARPSSSAVAKSIAEDAPRLYLLTWLDLHGLPPRLPRVRTLDRERSRLWSDMQSRQWRRRMGKLSRKREWKIEGANERTIQWSMQLKS